VDTVISALHYARDGLVAVFDHFDIGVADAFEPVERAVRKAVYVASDDESSD
jgi:hypothetical protein